MAKTNKSGETRMGIGKFVVPDLTENKLKQLYPPVTRETEVLVVFKDSETEYSIDKAMHFFWYRDGETDDDTSITHWKIPTEAEKLAFEWREDL